MKDVGEIAKNASARAAAKIVHWLMLGDGASHFIENVIKEEIEVAAAEEEN
jgi:hypothetical protein